MDNKSLCKAQCQRVLTEGEESSYCLLLVDGGHSLINTGHLVIDGVPMRHREEIESVVSTRAKCELGS